MSGGTLCYVCGSIAYNVEHMYVCTYVRLVTQSRVDCICLFII